MLNTKLLNYNIKIPLELRQMVYKMKYKNSLCACVVLTNLASGVRKGTSIVYSRDSGKTYHGKRKLTTRKIIQAIEFLESKGLLLNFPGKGHVDPKKREISYIQPTEEFMQKFNKFNNIRTEQDYIDAMQAIELRDAKKKELAYVSTEEIQAMESFVRQLNSLNEKSVVLTQDGQRLTNLYTRIFNENFKQGGRFYRADILNLPNREDHQRLRITIDGEPVVEVDYQTLHIRIAAALEEMDYEDVPTDMYADILEDPTNKVDRKIVKLAINIMFNSRSERTAQAAIQSEINKLTPSERMQYTLGSARAVVLVILDRYIDLAELFFDPESGGRALQNVDSHLAADVLRVFVEKEIPILCVHDSFVVQRRYLELLCSTMAEKFRTRLEQDWYVPLCYKWINEDGDVQEVKVQL